MQTTSNPTEETENFSEFRKVAEDVLKEQLGVLEVGDFVLYEEVPKGRWSIVYTPNFTDEQGGKLSGFINEVKAIEPNQIYTESDFHITLTFGETDAERVKQALKYIGDNYRDMRFDIAYLGTSPQAMAVHAIPINFSLSELRNDVNKILGIEKNYPILGMGGKVDDRNIFNEIGWIHLVRYLEQPTQAYLDFLRNNQGFSLGEVSLENIEGKYIMDKLFKDVRESHSLK